MSYTYNLRFPFTLSPGYSIKDLDQPIIESVENLSLGFVRRGDQYIVTVKGLPSEEKARLFVNEMWVALAWTMVDRGFGFNANMEIDSVYYADDPQKAAENIAASLGIRIDGPVDGFAGGDQPVVLPEGKHLRFASVGNAFVLVSSPFENFFSRFKQGLQLPEKSAVYLDLRMRTALELYSSYYYERSGNARLLALIMALEALAVPTIKAPIALDLLSKWKGEVEELKKGLDYTSDECTALESLERELLFRRESSLRTRVRNLVAQTLADDGLEDTKELERKAVGAYDNP